MSNRYTTGAPLGASTSLISETPVLENMTVAQLKNDIGVYRT